MIFSRRFRAAIALGGVLSAELLLWVRVLADAIRIGGVPAGLAVRPVGERCLRLTLKPVDHPEDFPVNPALAERAWKEPVVLLTELDKPVEATVERLRVRVYADPLTVEVAGKVSSMGANWVRQNLCSSMISGPIFAH